MITTSGIKILGLALLAGVVPSLIWLWFWFKEESENESKKLLAIIFILGMVSVLVVLPIQKLVQGVVDQKNLQIVTWAAIEEIIKYLVVFVIVIKTKYVNKPIDWPIYLITAALGFAALENSLFLIKPFSLNETTVGLLTGQLRFLGSTLLHVVSSGVIGISLGLSLNLKRGKKIVYLLSGLFIATTLHSVFNFFIMNNSGNDFLKVFGFLWVVTIIIMLLFEKLRAMSGNKE